MSRRKRLLAQLFDQNTDCCTFRVGKGAQWSDHGLEPCNEQEMGWYMMQGALVMIYGIKEDAQRLEQS